MERTKQRKNSTGFSLIELLVVATIIIILSAIGLVTFQNAGQNARNGKRKADMETVRQALVLYRSDGNPYPADDFESVTADLITAGYLSAPAPTDPKEDSGYVYTDMPNGFCICALMEGTNQGNSTNTACSFGTGSYYCAKNP